MPVPPPHHRSNRRTPASTRSSRRQDPPGEPCCRPPPCSQSFACAVSSGSDTGSAPPFPVVDIQECSLNYRHRRAALHLARARQHRLIALQPAVLILVPIPRIDEIELAVRALLRDEELLDRRKFSLVQQIEPNHPAPPHSPGIAISLARSVHESHRLVL